MTVWRSVERITLYLGREPLSEPVSSSRSATLAPSAVQILESGRDGRHLLRVLDLRQVALREAAFARKRLKRHAARFPRVADPATDLLTEGRHGKGEKPDRKLHLPFQPAGVVKERTRPTGEESSTNVGKGPAGSPSCRQPMTRMLGGDSR